MSAFRIVLRVEPDADDARSEEDIAADISEEVTLSMPGDGVAIATVGVGVSDGIYETIMGVVRGAMWERRLSYDTADRIAEAVGVGARQFARGERESVTS